MKLIPACVILLAGAAALPAMAQDVKPAAPTGEKEKPAATALTPGLTEVASLQMQITGLAVSKTGRLFVCSPYWHEGHTWSVAEIRKDGNIETYPNALLNQWRNAEGANRGIGLVCVQSLYIDDADALWMLDAGSPFMKGTLSGEGDGGGPKLIKVDLEKNRMARLYPMRRDIVPEQGYLNDVRVDAANNIAYISESGTGSIIALDLRLGRTRRLFDGNPIVRADENVKITIDGRELKPRDGGAFRVNVDGLALDRKNDWLYFQPLTSRRLHRVKAGVLRSIMKGADDRLNQRLDEATEDLGENVVTDGMIADDDGNVYFTAIERHAIMYRSPDGKVHTLIEGPELKWPDSMAIHDGELYFTTSQIHLTDRFSPDGTNPTDPYKVYKVKLPGKGK